MSIHRHKAAACRALVAALVVCASAAPASSAAAQVPPPISRTPPPVDAYPHVDTPPSGFAKQPGRVLKTAVASQSREVVADRVLVSFARGVTDADIAAISAHAASLGAGAARPVLKLRNGSVLVDVSGAKSVEGAAQAFRTADTRVVGASPDSIVTTSALPPPPNDPFIGGQWHLDTVQAQKAWARSHGDGMTIAILDSGIKESHPDLAGKIVDHTNTLWFQQSTLDFDGHGTAVAGIAAAATNNGIGVAGVGFNARMLNVKVLDDSGFIPRGTASSTASGIYWAVDHGANVINMSLAGTRDCNPWWIENLLDVGVAALRDAIDYAWSHNVVVVAGTGNTAGTGKLYPSACPHVLSVANTQRNDTMNPQSTHGTWVQVGAPGTLIFTTALAGGSHCQEFSQGDFADCSGASAAAPVVSGIAALVGASCGPIDNQGIVDRITSTADPIAGTGTNWQFGRVNAFKAVCLPAPTGFGLKTATDTSMTFEWFDNAPLARYQFAYNLDGSTATVTQQLPAHTTEYTVTGLTTGALYDFAVRACDDFGCSADARIGPMKANYLRLGATLSRASAGRITSTPAGIDCGSTHLKCIGTFPPGSAVTLVALGGVDPQTHDEYDFDHWEGVCSGTSPACTVTVTQPQQFARAVLVKVGNSGP